MEHLVRRLRVGEGKVEQGGRGVGGLERRWKGRGGRGKVVARIIFHARVKKWQGCGNGGSRDE